ncbi:MAG: response regulator [Gemmatimonadota bacterium]
MKWEDIIRNARILVVDDDPASVRLSKRMLDQAGYQWVISTSDGREVLRLYREFRPDLVLLDLHMPDKNGLDVMREIREDIGPEGYLPFLVVTGDAAPETKLRALVLGAKDFVTKPFDMVEVMLRIRIQLETRFQFLEMEQEIASLRKGTT